MTAIPTLRATVARRVVAAAPALGRRNYRIFITAQAISLVGTWMQTLGQAWLIVVLTRDPFVLGLVTVAQALPVLIFSLLGGVIADRWEKRRVLLVTPALSATLAAILGVLCLTGLVQVWHIAVLAFLLGMVNSVEIPVRQSFVVEMVGPELLPSAVGLNSAAYSGGRLVGPAVAGIVIGITTALVGSAVGGTGVAFLINAVSFVVVIFGFLSMRTAELAPAPRSANARAGRLAVLHHVAEGLDQVRRDRPVLVTFVIPGLISMLAINFGVLIPVLAIAYNLDAGGLGLLMAANGVGALTAALRMGLGGAANPGVLIRGALLLGASLVLAGLLTALGLPLPLTALLLFTAGWGAVSMRTATNASIQLATAPEVRGRVMSLFALVFEGISPMGAAVAGAIASRLGGPAAFVACGAAAILLVGLGAGELRRIRLDRARPAPDPANRAPATTPNARSGRGAEATSRR